MKKVFIIIVGSLILASISLFAGGKGVMPAGEPIEPVPELKNPIPVYIGLGLVWGKYDGTCGVRPDCPYEDVTYGAILRAGYEWNQYIGLEARALSTFWKDDPLGGQKLQHYGLFVKPTYPVSEDFNMYGLLGYGVTKTKTGGNKNLLELDDKGFSAGAGLEYDFSSKDDKDEDTRYDREFDGQADLERGWGLFVDYQRLLIKSDVPDLDVVSGGITYDF